jgi:hypothetical protein
MPDPVFKLRVWNDQIVPASASELVGYSVSNAGCHWSAPDRIHAEHARLVEIVGALVSRLPPQDVIDLLGLTDRCEVSYGG